MTLAAAPAELTPPTREEIAMIGRIPVRNLWLLMLYASGLYKDLQAANVATEDDPDDLPNLVAEMLCRRVEHRIQRNLSYGYQSRQAVLTRVRGRIELLTTERHRLLDRGKVACRFDELTVDTPRNRYVRTALEKICKIDALEKELKHRCRTLATSLRRMGVNGAFPDRSEILSVDRFGRHDADDRPMVAVARLALNLALPTEFDGSNRLSAPDKEIYWIRRLYEKAIAGFYDVMLSPRGWRIDAGKKLKWQIADMTPGIESIFPSMQTDIILDHRESGRRTIIDTKFNSVVTRGRHREETLRNGYVYQIYAYLRSQESTGDPMAENASGLLLHPSIGDTVNEAVTIQNHEIRFATVDLAATATEIKQQLLQVVGLPQTN